MALELSDIAPSTVDKFVLAWNSSRSQQEAVTACSNVLQMEPTDARRIGRLLLKAGMLNPLPLLDGQTVWDAEDALAFLLVWNRARNLDRVVRFLNIDKDSALLRARALRAAGVAIRDLPGAVLERPAMPDLQVTDIPKLNEELVLELAIRKALVERKTITSKFTAALELLGRFKKKNKTVDADLIGAVSLVEDVLRDIGVI